MWSARRRQVIDGAESTTVRFRDGAQRGNLCSRVLRRVRIHDPDAPTADEAPLLLSLVGQRNRGTRAEAFFSFRPRCRHTLNRRIIAVETLTRTQIVGVIQDLMLTLNLWTSRKYGPSQSTQFRYFGSRCAAEAHGDDRDPAGAGSADAPGSRSFVEHSYQTRGIKRYLTRFVYKA
jgi:hypothetical protein